MAYTTIDDPELYFQCKTYTGTGSSLAITLDGSEDMQPDMVWIKERNGSTNHMLIDAVRGATKPLHTQNTDTESTVAESLKTFDSDGFTVGTEGDVNTGSDTYAAWCWKESADAGFDIVTYTGDGSVRTISHSLSAVPHLMIQKKLSGTAAWTVYHHKMASDPETDYLYLSTNAAVGDYADHWNDTAPTSSVFTLGTDTSVNGSSATNVMYLFTAKQGFSSIGKYIGNGNVNGATVWCGFSPAFVLIKSTASGVWRMWDNKRDALNPNTANFQANAADAEYDHSSVAIDFLSSGFKARSTDSSYNGNGTTYVYYAAAGAPFVNSEGVPNTGK